MSGVTRRPRWRGAAAGSRLLLGTWMTLAALAAGAQDPIREEQLVFSLLAYNGRQYVPAFAREPVTELYLLAGRPAVLAPRIAFVHYWPLTRSWRVDTGTLNIAVGTTLEVLRGGRDMQSFQRTAYTFYNVPRRYEANWEIATGAEAQEAYDRYLELFSAYQRETVAFNRARAEYERRVAELARRIADRHAAGSDAGVLEEERDALQLPHPPERSWERFFSVPPVAVREGFVIELPAGRYRMRLLTADGRILQGSEKRIIAFAKLRSGGVGYDVMPADRWTRPTVSSTPGAILYVDGSTDLYLRPHFQDQYNDLHYARLVDADGIGNARLTRWEKTGQIPGAMLAVRGGRGRETAWIEEAAHLVQQVEGGRLGYRVVPFEPGPGTPPRPDLVAFGIALDGGIRRVRLALADHEGAIIAGGERQIRVVEDAGRGWLLAFAAIPLVVIAALLIGRARRYR